MGLVFNDILNFRMFSSGGAHLYSTAMFLNATRHRLLQNALYSNTYCYAKKTAIVSRGLPKQFEETPDHVTFERPIVRLLERYPSRDILNSIKTAFSRSKNVLQKYDRENSPPDANEVCIIILPSPSFISSVNQRARGESPLQRPCTRSLCSIIKASLRCNRKLIFRLYAH